MKLKSLPIVLTALFLNACAGLHDHDVPDAYQAPPEQAAYMIGSMGLKTTGENKSPNNYSWIYFRQRGDDDKASILVSQSFYYDVDRDYKERDREGSVFSLALEPGDYEFMDVRFFYNTGTVQTTHRAEEEFSLPFSLEAGKVYYLGEFLAYGRYGENFLGFTVPAGGYFEHRMNSERDLPLSSGQVSRTEGQTDLRARPGHEPAALHLLEEIAAVSAGGGEPHPHRPNSWPSAAPKGVAADRRRVSQAAFVLEPAPVL